MDTPLDNDVGTLMEAADRATARPRVTMDDLSDLGERLFAFQDAVKATVHKPEGQKSAPRYNGSQLAALCQRSPDAMMRLLEKADERGLASGDSGSKVKSFTLAEARAWVRALSPAAGKPAGAKAMTLAIANFKGGVGKTVVTMCLAQGLSLKGYKVLCIDYDPQGSLTTLAGVSTLEVRDEETVLPLMYERDHEHARDTLQNSIRPTYWDGVDLVPGTAALFGGEFFLPLRQMKGRSRDSTEADFWFYDVLNKALDQGIRDHYDYILIDTPPALSYMVLTAVWAADALLLPLPPEGIDFMSSAQFWALLSELATPSITAEKTYSWVGVVASKVDTQAGQTMKILKWMKAAYSEKLLSAEVPDTAAVKVGGMNLQTVYDISKYIGSQKTLARARTAFDKLVDEVDYLTRSTHWA